MSQQTAKVQRPDMIPDNVTTLPPTTGQGDGWKSAPFEAALAAQIQALVARLDPTQRAWLSGYLAGSLAHQGQPGLSLVPAPGQPVTILYGSESGNSSGLAKQVAARLEARQIRCKVLDMLDCRKTDLEQARQLLVVVSTHGDGEPPEHAIPLFELLTSRKAPRLPELQFAVLALGDRSYEQFCAAGQQLDARLAELGGKRLRPRVDCDVDFESAATEWMESVAALLADSVTAATATPAGVAATSTVLQAWTRKHPFQAPVLANHALTARGSSKDVRHVELSLEESGIQYEPGDALGIVPANPQAEVDALLAVLKQSPDAAVEVGDSATTLHTALLRHCEIGTLTPSMLRRYAEATGHAELQRITADKSLLQEFSWGRDVRDLVTQYPPRDVDAAGFARLLSPLAPRLYSIASSQRSAADEVHLTIGVVTYESQGRQRQGVVSGTIAGLSEDANLPVYLHRNEGFRLPVDAATPIVMIGAGTGAAPYRAFLADREATGATGRNWLFFGDRSFEFDFLYQSEWLAWRRSGLLTRLDVAFSRDQADKIYVQHRLREQAAELWRWLQEGAHLYICGDATHMAPDVENALLGIAAQQAGLDADGARDYLRQLQRERRYQKDVY